jgi:hypothetical protein
MQGWKNAARVAVALCFAAVLAACSNQSLLATPPTVYDLTQRPAEFANKDVTVQGVYLWKPGDPGMSVLIPALSTADGVRDAQPIYASVTCAENGECTPSTTAVGERSTGSVWLEGFPADVTANLHTPGDSVWGFVEVTGRFENAGNYGPDGAYRYQMQVTSAKPLQKVEHIVATIPTGDVPEGVVPFTQLVDQADQYNGQQVTTRAYYYWSQPTSGTLTESVTREQTPDSEAGLNPQPQGRTIALDGFPPDLSAQINVGENNTYVWGLVEVTGTFESNGTWGPNGEYSQHFTITDGQVTVLEPNQ